MKVAAIIVTYNPDVDLLRRQNEELGGQVDFLIYVDNASQDTSLIDKLSSDRIIINKNDKNFGLAKAQNQGISIAQKIGVDFVVLFDQDSVPPVGFVEALTHCYNEQSRINKVGLVGPAIRNLTTKNRENEKGVLFRGLFVDTIYLDEATEVSYCIASGSLIPITVIEEVGGMEEKMFIDGLDVEWCLRAQSKGYKIFQTNSTYLEHCLGDGTKRRILSHSPQREYYIMRNAIWLSRQKYVPGGYRLRKALFSSGRLLQSLVNLKGSYIKADIEGIIDGIKI